MAISLRDFVEQFAAALNAADGKGPSAVSPRSGRVYQLSIGPHAEDGATTTYKMARPAQRSWRNAEPQLDGRLGGYQRPSVAALRAHFAEMGLTGAFWDL